jgi:hypothetical protein
MAATDTAHVDGDLAMQLVSRTSSTKWAYQVVTVEAGRTYDFAGFTAAGPGTDEAFLRVSWYASTDGAGSMIASEDSPSASSATAAFQHLSTGAIEAPAEARSAKLRLMLRPASAALAVSYFDSLSFGETTAAPVGSRPAVAGSAGGAAAGSTAERGPGVPPPLVLGAAAVPPIANVQPGSAEGVTTAQDNGKELLFFLGSIAVPLIGFAVIASIELSHRRRSTTQCRLPQRNAAYIIRRDGRAHTGKDSGERRPSRGRRPSPNDRRRRLRCIW